MFIFRIVHSETSIPVATSAPDGYLECRASGLGKVLKIYFEWNKIYYIVTWVCVLLINVLSLQNIGSDVKWLDGGKPLLKLSTKVLSTVHTQVPTLTNKNHFRRVIEIRVEVWKNEFPHWVRVLPTTVYTT